MRKVLLIFLLLVVLVIGGAAVAFLAVDINQFRPLLITKVQDATKRQVELASIHRSWSGGLGLELRGLVLHEEPRFGAEPFLRVERATARLRLAPLFQRRIEIAGITLESPSVRIIRDASGQLNVLTLAPQPAAPAQPSSAPSPAAALSLLIGHITVKNAQVHFEDRATQPPLTGDFEHVDATASDISLMGGVPQATLVVRHGTLRNSQMARLVDALTLDARLTATDAVIERSSGVIGNGTISKTARITNYRSPQPEVEGTLTMEQVAVQDLMPPQVATAEQRLEGKLSGSARMRGTGKTWPELQPTLTGEANFSLAEGRVTNLNILREALAKFSMLPGVVERLEAKLPERHRQLLQQRDTALHDARVTARIEQGALHIDPLNVGTDVGTLQGRGRVGLDGTLALTARINIPKDLSESMIRVVEELKYLAGRSGEITFPLVVSGKPPQIAVQPDLQYIAQRVLVSKGEELIGDLLKRAIGGDEQAPPSAQDQQPATPPADERSTEQLLHDLFGGDR